MTFRNAAQVRLVSLRPRRPAQLRIEASWSTPAPFRIDANSVGSDSRGLAIDPLVRKRAEAACHGDSACLNAAALVPLDVYVANRSPSSLLIGRTRPPLEYPYFFQTLALTTGPSRVVVGQVKTPSGDEETARVRRLLRLATHLRLRPAALTHRDRDSHRSWAAPPWSSIRSASYFTWDILRILTSEFTAWILGPPQPMARCSAHLVPEGSEGRPSEGNGIARALLGALRFGAGWLAARINRWWLRCAPCRAAKTPCFCAGTRLAQVTFTRTALIASCSTTLTRPSSCRSWRSSPKR